MGCRIVRWAERVIRRFATEQELAEINTVIDRTKAMLVSKEVDRGCWEGKTACWELLACPRELYLKCPAPRYRSFYCWEIEGTYNKLSDDGTKGDDTHICESCRVYKKWGQGKPIQINIFRRGFNIRSLIADLSSEDGHTRECARLCLVAMGKRAVPHLIKVLSEPDRQVRWEAAKAIGSICDARAVHALIKLLEDDVFEVRWLAAEGLAALRQDALLPLVHAVVHHSDSPWVRQGAHHVLSEWIRRDIRDELNLPWMHYREHRRAFGWLTENVSEILWPLLYALEDNEAEIRAPIAAQIARDAFTGTTRQQANAIA